MTPRIAVVEHGDAREARRLRAAGAPEPYFGMHDSQGYIDRWVAGRPHLIVSLNAPHYRDHDNEGILLGLPEPQPIGRLPGTITHIRWANQISRQLRDFRPTHFLLRTGSLLGAMLLRTAIRHHWFTLAMFAGVFPRARPYDRLLTCEIVRLLNHPLVFAAGNHRQPATDSMFEAGLHPNKAIAWDYTGVTREPADFQVKRLTAGPTEIVYAGVLSVAKGVAEVIDATIALRLANRDVRLTLIGTGPDMAAFQTRSAPLGNAIAFLGRVPNDEVFRRMAAATLVCVPSRHEFPEGFPQTLTEALVSRTPVMASDHPVFTRVLRDGEGLRYFPAGDTAALASRMSAVLNDSAVYEDLSRQTAVAYEKLRCRVRFDDVIEAWLPAPRH
ncbi:MAG TPA: glycosyltransferase [Gemmataceae bacterium]|jgi:glycosyltransferase involved in cell wall biosynthesis|nr:glycosyltransferase [Gemmataceae bacterium]